MAGGGADGRRTDGCVMRGIGAGTGVGAATCGAGAAGLGAGEALATGARANDGLASAGGSMGIGDGTAAAGGAMGACAGRAGARSGEADVFGGACAGDCLMGMTTAFAGLAAGSRGGCGTGSGLAA